MLSILRSVFLILDIAPLSWAGLFLRPVLIAAVIVLAVAVLIMTIKERKREKNASVSTVREKRAEEKESDE